jgi:PAS domain S-box-containing protein
MPPDDIDHGLEPALASALFGALAQAAFGFVSCIDRQRRVLFLNRTLSRELSAVIGKPMEDFVAEPHRQAVIDCVEAAFDSGAGRELEYTVVLGDRTQRDQHTRIVPFRGPQGEALAMMITDDITDRRSLIAELERGVEFRRRVIEHLPDYVVMIDREHRFVWTNRVAPGLTSGDVLGKRLEDFGDTGPTGHAVIDAAFESGTVGQYESEGYGDGTSSAWYLVRVVPIVLGGKIEHVLCITSDITERKHAELALRRTQGQLHQAQRLESLGQLAGGVAHDFNNLLQIIQSNLYFVQHSLSKGQSATDEIEQAQRATERAAELTSHLLAIGRRKHVDSRRVELGTLVAQSVRMLRRAIPENIGVHYEAPAQQQFVELDAPQFEQVLINLCVNARDAMPDGGSLSIGIEPEGDSHVVLYVTDTGAGIAPENLPRVFEPFFTTKGAGSGLGLAVAAGIVGAHGGVITAESDGRTGTTMKIRLPRVASEAAQPAVPPLRAVSGSGLILVAEDEELVRSQLVRILESAGYRVIQAHNGVAAVDAFRARRGEVDLVILDVVMPELDGWQAFLRIAELEPRVKVLFTTGYAASVLPEDFAARGARFLSKPYKPQVLLASIHELLAAHPRPAGAG